METRAKISAGCNIFVAVMTAVAVVMMMAIRAADGASLTATGLAALKFFTVLSNLFSGIVSAVFAVVLIRSRGRIPAALGVFKLMATVAVGVTFFTVVVLFEVIFGLRGMFIGANLWFHLILPLVSLIEFCVLDKMVRLKLPSTFAALIPTALYGIAYYANIVMNGIGEWPDTNDWYGFLSFGGLESAPIVFIVMLAGTWIIALVIWGLNRLSRRSAR